MAGLGYALAGAVEGLGEGIVEQAAARREDALLRLKRKWQQQDRLQERAWDEQDYQRERRDALRDRDARWGRDDRLTEEERALERERTQRNADALRSTAGGSLLDVIDATENGGGGYDTLFGHSQNDGPFSGTRVSEMTLGEIRSFSSPRGEYGRWVAAQNNGTVATPMGRYQIVGSTLSQAARELGLSDDTVFTPEVQDQIAQHLLDKRLASAKTVDGKIKAVRQEWAGLKHVDDEVLAQAIRRYEAGDEAFLVAGDESTPAAVREPVMAGLGVGAGTQQTKLTHQRFIPHPDQPGKKILVGQDESGNTRPVPGLDGQPVIEDEDAGEGEKKAAKKLSSGQRVFIERRLEEAYGIARDEWVDAVEDEAVRLMNEQDLSEADAVDLALESMEREQTEETRTEGGFLGIGGSEVTETVEGEFTGRFRPREGAPRGLGTAQAATERQAPGDVDTSHIPEAAIAALKADPSLREQFDAKYGPGTAAAVLGE